MQDQIETQETTSPEVLENTIPHQPLPKKKDKGGFFETVKFILIVLAIGLPIRMYIAQPFIVSGQSMFPTFHNGEYLIVDEISYRFKEPERGDVVVFRYPNDPSKFFIKRIVGLPGEEVSIKGKEITILNEEHPEGFILPEPYTENKQSGVVESALENDEYFVMGDNRTASSDSRSWGPLQEDFLVGRAWVRLFPVDRIDFLPGKESSEVKV
ncbi:MAG: signal peptidase I [Flavobacteriaceae bacterium]|jgi:signal peptidase I